MKEALFDALLGSVAQITMDSLSAPMVLGRVDKRDSHDALIVIQAGICDGAPLGTRLDVGRGMAVS